MKRKGVYLIAAALFMASNQVLMTGCQKDYDGQIEMLKNQIQSGTINVDGLIKKIELIEKQIAALQEAVKEHADMKVQIEALIQELNATKADLQSQIDELKKAMEIYDLNVKELIAQAEKRFEAKLNELSERIDKEIGEKYNELKGQIQDLQNQINAMKDSYDKTIAELTQRIEALENMDAPQGNVDELKKQLEALKALVDNNMKEIEALKDNQTLQAQKLVKLEETVNQFIISMNANYNQLCSKVEQLNGRVDELFKLYEELLLQIPDLGELKATVARHEKEIADLQLKLQELNGKLDGFVTADEVQQMLDNYYNKAEIDKLLADLAAKLDQTPNKEEIDRLIAEAMKGVQEQISAMQNKLDELKTQIDQLQGQVDQLFNRIQSMSIIPQFATGEVELRPMDGNNYQLAIRVKVNPAQAVKDMVNLKDYFHIDSREAIVARAAGDRGPKFTVVDVAADEADPGVFTVKAQCSLEKVDPIAHTMPFTVAVEFKNADNERGTEYTKVRFVPAQSTDQTPYVFKSGSEVLKTGHDSGFLQFNAGNTYVRNVLGAVENINGGVLTQIMGSTPVFAAKVLGSSQKIAENKDIPAFYGLAAIYDAKGVSHMELINYISVNSVDGSLSMKNNLAAGVTVTDLTGYKLVISLQARQNGFNYGEPAYVCVELQKK